MTDSTQIRFNPLADYKAQTRFNPKQVKKKVKDTTLAGDLSISPFLNQDDKEFYITEDMAAFNYSKVVTSAFFRNMILKTKPSTQSLFLWIIFQLEYVRDTVEINPSKTSKLGLLLSPNSLDSAIIELEELQIIKRIGKKRESDYWLFHINPQYIFKGDAKKYYNNILEKHPEYALNQTITPTQKKKRLPAKSVNAN